MAASIQDEVFLRYSGKGHLRYSLPAGLCTAEAASRVERGLIREAGVYRVKVSRGNRKLSVRFRDDAVEEGAVNTSLAKVVASVPPEAMVEPEPPAGSQDGAAGLARAPSAMVARMLLKRGLPTGLLAGGMPANLVIDKETEHKLTSVINEVILFYLIKLHWDVITNRLVKRPLHNLGPWFTLSYLLFLYVRHKKAD